LNYAAGTVAAGGAVLNVRGPGAGAGKEVFVNIRTEGNAGSGYYAWRMRGAVGYGSGLTEGTQPGEQQFASYFNLWQNSISYWFWVNDRRFIVMAKMSTVYSSIYAGFFLPFALPANYPFPLYISGTYGSFNSYSLGNSGHRFFADPGGSIASPSTMIRLPDGTWLPISNHDLGSSNDDGIGSGRSAIGFTWPYCVGESANGASYTQAGTSYTGQASGGLFDNMVATRQGEYGMFPISIHGNIDPPVGVLDGAFCVPGSGLVTEQSVTTAGRTFKLFQNLSRNSGNDFVAIESI
jgi:hypothetical protein